MGSAILAPVSAATAALGSALTGSVLHGSRSLFGGSSSDASYDPASILINQPGINLHTQLQDFLSQQIGKGLPAYPGQLTAGLSPLQQQAISQAGQVPQSQAYNAAVGSLMSLLTPGSAGYQQMTPTPQENPRSPLEFYSPAEQAQRNAQQGISAYSTQMQPAQRTLMDIIQQPFDTEGAQKYWETSFVKPSTQLWEKYIVPKIKEHYIGLGAGRSGAENRAVARSAEDLTSKLSGQLADILYKGRQASLDRAIPAAQAASAVASRTLPFQTYLAENARNMAESQAQQVGAAQGRNIQRGYLDVARGELPIKQQMANISAQGTGLSALPQITKLPISLESALGGLQQLTQQNALTAAYNEWLRQQAYSNPYLNLLPVALGNSYNPLPIIASPPTQTPGLLSSMMPGIGSGIGAALTALALA